MRGTGLDASPEPSENSWGGWTSFDRRSSAESAVLDIRHAILARMEFHPLTSDRWKDLEALFGPRGACAGCWCMWWRLPRSAWTRGKGDGNRRELRKLVQAGPPPGILAYEGGEPVGWCAIAPRPEYPALGRSRVLAPVDDRPAVWSVTCFFVSRPFRRRGVTVQLLKAAVRHARDSGARIVEGYPVVSSTGSMPDAFAYTGLPSAYEKAGFTEVARRSPSRPIMRRVLRSPRPRS
jgi:GNAT superfamily N-acetyltransferase